MSRSLQKRISHYLVKCAPAVSGEHGHDATFKVACILTHGFGLSAEEALPFMAEFNARCQPPWPERDLRRKLSEALAHAEQKKPRGYLLGKSMTRLASSVSLREPPRTEAKLSYLPKTLTRVAKDLDFEVTPNWLAERSPISPTCLSPASALYYLFQPGERVLVFSDYFSQGIVWQHPGKTLDPKVLDYLKIGHRQGAWFLSNPVNGKTIDLERLRSEHNPRGRTRRAEENITVFRYAVVESDKAPQDVWLALLAQIPLPITSITRSGGDSIHALVKIDAANKVVWDRLVRVELLPILVTLGADSAALTSVRLTRLPNCRREEKNALQELLYLDPKPDGKPICERPVPERPETPWLRWAKSLLHWKDLEGGPYLESVMECYRGLSWFRGNSEADQVLRELEKSYEL